MAQEDGAFSLFCIVRGMTYNGEGAAVCGVYQLGKQAKLPYLVNKAWRVVEKL